MQTITMTLSVVTENRLGTTLIGIGALIVGPPVMKRLTGLICEFWGPRITRLRRLIAERVAPDETPAAAEEVDEEIVRLHDRS
ncbi:hypothetical protein OTB20_25415 [Streptomyces sp. H27-H1]|uniref:hypothetical protein n=1 Tax=unclassified Streptomyces TaxID=2593676 RepID=UPI00226FED3E|nr:MULTISPECIES: hypothetical protein [unclassified Streptomyces]MCY0929479.1 hypothetical protein [Streptomyces sp. H27-H1]MCY0938305.1 hypothetical protein [Streptomyces sp. H34-S4]